MVSYNNVKAISLVKKDIWGQRESLEFAHPEIDGKIKFVGYGMRSRFFKRHQKMGLRVIGVENH